jgi:hypothetical protein
MAAAAYEEIIDPRTSVERRAHLSTALLRYCERDTEAMLRLLLRLNPALSQRVESTRQGRRAERRSAARRG